MYPILFILFLLDKKVVFSQTLEPSFSDMFMIDMFMIPREEGTEFHVFQEFALGNIQLSLLNKPDSSCSHLHLKFLK